MLMLVFLLNTLLRLMLMITYLECNISIEVIANGVLKHK